MVLFKRHRIIFPHHSKRQKNRRSNFVWDSKLMKKMIQTSFIFFSPHGATVESQCTLVRSAQTIP